jgi:hypothetical protein
MVEVDSGTKPLSSPPVSPPETRMSPFCGPIVGVEVAVAVGVPDVDAVGVAVAVTVGVADPDEVAVEVGEPDVVEVGVGEPDVVGEGVAVLVAVGVPDPDEVGVEVGEPDVVGVGVGVAVAEAVGVPDPVMVGVGVGVAVILGVICGVGVCVGVGVGVAVGVAVPLIPFPDNANLMFPPLLLTDRPLLRKILPAEVGLNTIIMSQRLDAGRDPSQVSLTSLKGGLTVMLLILIAFFLFVLMSATDIGALVVPTRTGPKSAPRMILEPLLRNCLEVLWTCKSPSDCANAGRASAVSMNNSAKVKVASDRVIDLIPMIKSSLRQV